MIYVAFSPDGKKLATCVGNKMSAIVTRQPNGVLENVRDLVREGKVQLRTGVLQLWDPQTGQSVGKPCTLAGQMSFVEFSPDGSKMVATSYLFDDFGDGTARVWDVETQEPASDVIQLPFASLQAHFTPDGRQVVACGGPTAASDDPDRSRSQACIVDLETGKTSRHTLPHRQRITAFGFGLQGRDVITGSWDHSVCSWNAATGQLTGPELPQPHEVIDLDVTRDGVLVATATANGTVQFWNTATGTAALTPLSHTARATEVQFSDDGGRLLTVSSDKGVRVWNLRSKATLATFEHDQPAGYVQFLENDRLMVLAGHVMHRNMITAYDDVSIREGVEGTQASIWSLTTGARVRQVTALPDGSIVRSVDARGNRLVAYPHVRSGRVALRPLVWDFRLSRFLETIPALDAQVQAAVLDADGLHLVSATEHTIQFWDLETGKSSGHAVDIDPRSGRVERLLLSPDRRRAAAVLEEPGQKGYYVIQLFDTATGNHVGTVAAIPNKICAELQPRQSSVAGRQRESWRWTSTLLVDAESGQRLSGSVRHAAAISHVCMTPDGQTA